MRPALLSPALAMLLALPATGGAQARGGSTRDTVPLSMLPPAGKCRIWVEGVPAAQQPAPTDCATALRQKPANGILLYGPAQRDGANDRFDPKVGQEPRGATADQRAEKQGGSAGERELERRRQAAERARLLQELRERDERARRDAQERGTIMGAGTRGSATANPSTPRGTTAVPRASTGSSTAPPADPAPKSPPEGKRKPE